MIFKMVRAVSQDQYLKYFRQFKVLKIYLFEITCCKSLYDNINTWVIII